MGERRPGLDEDEDDHRRRAGRRRHTTSAPSMSSARRSDEPRNLFRGQVFLLVVEEVSLSRHPPSTSSCSWLRLNAGTPPALAMILPGDRAVPDPVDELAAAPGSEPFVGSTRKMYRDSGYLSFLTCFALQGTPLTFSVLTALALPGETEVADRVRVAGLTALTDQAVGRQRVDVRRRRLVVEHRLEEEVVRPSVGVTADRVDRRALVRTRAPGSSWS